MGPNNISLRTKPWILRVKDVALNHRATQGEKSFSEHLRVFSRPNRRTFIPHWGAQPLAEVFSSAPAGHRAHLRPAARGKTAGPLVRRQAVAESSRLSDSQCLSVEVSKGALLFTYSQRPQKEVGPLGTGNPPNPSSSATTTTSNTTFFPFLLQFPLSFILSW